ncbi:MAG: FtsX-like permease family protein [Silvibacterium sp.]
MALFSSFAALGLALAAIGIYSVISYNVTQRVQEIGVRMALGAKRGDILKLILLMVARLAVLGLAIGLLGSFLVERLVRFQVFAKTSFGVIPLAMIVLGLAGVALLAARGASGESRSRHGAAARGVNLFRRRFRLVSWKFPSQLLGTGRVTH